MVGCHQEDNAVIYSVNFISGGLIGAKLYDSPGWGSLMKMLMEDSWNGTLPIHHPERIEIELVATDMEDHKANLLKLPNPLIPHV
jgi:hypothetical protein